MVRETRPEMTRFFALLGALGLVAACASTGTDSAASDSSEINAASPDACTARLHFLQKDAYKEGAGRTSDFWPPHTTTVLDVTCNGVTTSSFMANHGTKPDAKDAAGTTILVEAPMPDAVVTTKGTKAEMDALVAAYAACECESDAFLSLDQVNPQVFEIVNEVAALFTCAEPTEALVAAAKAKDLDGVKRILAGCSLKSDVTPADVEETTADIETKVKTTLAGKHVCNNDAQLQADLFTHFRDTKEVKACDAHDAARCQFPALFFRPAREIE